LLIIFLIFNLRFLLLGPLIFLICVCIIYWNFFLNFFLCILCLVFFYWTFLFWLLNILWFCWFISCRSVFLNWFIFIDPTLIIVCFFISIFIKI
jgi:hypothetical protein